MDLTQQENNKQEVKTLYKTALASGGLIPYKKRDRLCKLGAMYFE